MPYTITLSNGTVVSTVTDQTFDTVSTSLTLVGRGAVNYGVPFDQNFIYLMENFSNNVPPSNPLVGQFWYDTSVSLMKVYQGSNVWTAFANSGGLGTTVGLPQGTTLGGVVSGPNRIAGSTGYTLLNTTTNNSTTVCLNLSEGKIISVASVETIPYSVLPGTILIQGIRFTFAPRFPNGLKAGVTLATDIAGYVNAGLATSSLYADIAERYAADQPMSPGDVVSIGGEKEITLTVEAEDCDVFGIVSTAPSVRMNDEAGDDVTHPLIGLVGRLPCKVVGPVRKGQRLVSAGLPGAAKAAEGMVDQRAIIGRALVTKTSFGMELIEVVIGRA